MEKKFSAARAPVLMFLEISWPAGAASSLSFLQEILLDSLWKKFFTPYRSFNICLSPANLFLFWGSSQSCWFPTLF